MTKRTNNNKKIQQPKKKIIMPKPQPKPKKRVTTFGKIVKGVGSIANKFIPGSKFLADGIASVLGSGDYVTNSSLIKSNSLTTGQTPPQFNSPGATRATVISHREYLLDVTTGATLVNGATAFSYNSFNINPALPQTFPWLAQIAENYEEYEMLGCIFEYKSTSANALNSTNTALGTVVMSTDYNVLNPPFINKLTQENYELSQSIKPSESCLHAVECARSMNTLTHLYTRTGPSPTVSSDLRLYDLGQFQLSTVGMQATNVTIGELWVTYHVALYKPKLPAYDAGIFQGDSYINNTYSNNYPLTGNVSNQLPIAGSNIGTSASASLISGNPSTILSFPTNVITGSYKCSMLWTGGTGVAWAPPAVSSLYNCTIIAPITEPAIPASGVTTSSCMLEWYVAINGPSAQLNIGVATLPTSASKVKLEISPYNSAIEAV